MLTIAWEYIKDKNGKVEKVEEAKSQQNKASQTRWPCQ